MTTAVDYPPILAFVTGRAEDVRHSCPCGSGKPYSRCCHLILATGQYHDQILYMDRVFSDKDRTYYLYHPTLEDISHA